MRSFVVTLKSQIMTRRIMQPFIHLHVHSQYSVLDGQASVKALVDKAIADGMPGIALTDHGNMYGAKDFIDCSKQINSRIDRKISECRESIKDEQELKDKINY